MGIKSIGGLMIVMAIGSLILPFMGIQFRVFSQIDQAGLGVGLVVRLALLVVGIVVYRAGDQLE